MRPAPIDSLPPESVSAKASGVCRETMDGAGARSTTCARSRRSVMATCSLKSASSHTRPCRLPIPLWSRSGSNRTLLRSALIVVPYLTRIKDPGLQAEPEVLVQAQPQIGLTLRGELMIGGTHLALV